MIIYGGTKEQIKKALACEHQWGEPCMDDRYRYVKCLKCYCVDRDTNEEVEDPVAEHLDKFVRRHFEVLSQLELISERRKDALRTAEERRDRIMELEKQLDFANRKADMHVSDWMDAKHKFGVRIKEMEEELEITKVLHGNVISNIKLSIKNQTGEELEESIRFLMDMDPKGEEWLPEPNPSELLQKADRRLFDGHTLDVLESFAKAADDGEWKGLEEQENLARADAVRIPARVRSTSRDNQGRRTTKYIAVCESAGTDNDANAVHIGVWSPRTSLEVIAELRSRWEEIENIRAALKCDPDQNAVEAAVDLAESFIRAEELMDIVVANREEIVSNHGPGCYGVPFDDVNNMEAFLCCTDDSPGEVEGAIKSCNKGGWDEYAQAMRDAGCNPEHATKYLRPLVGRTFTTPDGKISDTVLGFVPDGPMEIDRKMILDKPAEFIVFNFTEGVKELCSDDRFSAEYVGEYVRAMSKDEKSEE